MKVKSATEISRPKSWRAQNHLLSKHGHFAFHTIQFKNRARTQRKLVLISIITARLDRYNSLKRPTVNAKLMENLLR